MIFDAPNTILLEGRLIVLDLSRLSGGKKTVLRFIDSEPGVYAWFQNFCSPHLRPKATGQEFYDALTQRICAKHCADVRGRLAPLFKVTLSSLKRLSKPKRNSLREWCDHEDFRSEMSQLLNASLLFSQPLYVGCSKNLRTRIGNHFDGVNSELRDDLKQINIDIGQCWLAILRLPNKKEVARPKEEQLVEDVISKLFHPLFTKRYG